MGKKERISSVLQMVGGKRENVEAMVTEMDRFFDHIHAEVEDWKLSMEDSPDGTRIFARFQVLIRR